MMDRVKINRPLRIGDILGDECGNRAMVTETGARVNMNRTEYKDGTTILADGVRLVGRFGEDVEGERAEYATQALRDAASDLAAVRKAPDPHRRLTPPTESDVQVIDRLAAAAAAPDRWEQRVARAVDEGADNPVFRHVVATLRGLAPPRLLPTDVYDRIIASQRRWPRPGMYWTWFDPGGSPVLVVVFTDADGYRCGAASNWFRALRLDELETVPQRWEVAQSFVPGAAERATREQAAARDAGILLGLRAVAILTADHDCGEEHDDAMEALQAKIMALTADGARSLVEASSRSAISDVREQSVADDQEHVIDGSDVPVLRVAMHGSFPDGVWSRCAITNVRGASTMRVYVDGVLVERLTTATFGRSMPYALGWDSQKIAEAREGFVTVEVRLSGKARVGLRSLTVADGPLEEAPGTFGYTVDEVGGTGEPVNWFGVRVVETRGADPDRACIVTEEELAAHFTEVAYWPTHPPIVAVPTEDPGVFRYTGDGVSAGSNQWDDAHFPEPAKWPDTPAAAPTLHTIVALPNGMTLAVPHDGAYRAAKVGDVLRRIYRYRGTVPVVSIVKTADGARVEKETAPPLHPGQYVATKEGFDAARRADTYTETHAVGGLSSKPAHTPKIQVGQVWQERDGRMAAVTRLPPATREGPLFQFNVATAEIAASGAFSPGYGVIFDCEHDLVTTNGCKLIAGPGSPWSEP